MTKEIEFWLLVSTNTEKKDFQLRTTIIWRSPELKRSIHFKGLYCSENAQFFNSVDEV